MVWREGRRFVLTPTTYFDTSLQTAHGSISSKALWHTACGFCTRSNSFSASSREAARECRRLIDGDGDAAVAAGSNQTNGCMEHGLSRSRSIYSSLATRLAAGSWQRAHGGSAKSVSEDRARQVLSPLWVARLLVWSNGSASRARSLPPAGVSRGVASDQPHSHGARDSVISSFVIATARLAGHAHLHLRHGTGIHASIAYASGICTYARLYVSHFVRDRREHDISGSRLAALICV